MSVTLTLTDQWSDGKRVHAIGTLAFTGNYTLGGDTLDLGTAGVLTTESPVFAIAPIYRGYSFEYVPGTVAADGKIKVYGTGDTAATGVLTWDNAVANPSDGDTVTIGTRTYTFKTALTPTVNEGLIGADGDAALTNLSRAINHTGTPGTDYASATTINTQVSCGARVGHTITVTALVSGTGGNAVATTKVAAKLSWGAATLVGGADQGTNGSELSAAAYPTDLKTFSPNFLAVLRQLA